MVIIHLSGGFGNQLYSFAFGYALARKREEELAIDTAIQDAPWFFRNPDILKMNITYDRRITYPIRRDLFSRAVMNRLLFRKAIGLRTRLVQEGSFEGNLMSYQEALRESPAIYLKGNWGSIKYFEDYRKDILKMYTFPAALSCEAAEWDRRIRANEKSVTLHCRRGDYVKLGACMKPDYYIRAMEYMKRQLGTPVFYCISEDLEWLKQQFKGLDDPIEYVDYASEDKGVEDFRLLTAGRHQIIANSSYSWWAAFLNSNPHKIVTAPFGGIWDQEFCLPEWVGMPFETIPAEG